MVRSTYGVEITPPSLEEPVHKVTVTVQAQPDLEISFHVLINERSWVRIKSLAGGSPLTADTWPLVPERLAGRDVDIHLSGIVSADEAIPVTVRRTGDD